MVSDTIQWGNNTVRLTWLPAKTKPTDFPYTQSYGIVFNENGEILIINNGHWTLPGGTPEGSETAQETLKRELMEEADITVKEVELLGSQKVEYLNGHNTDYEEGDVYYQLRFVCLLNELLPQTPDPDNGKIYQRLFVHPKDIDDYVKWGDIGKEIFNSAQDWFLNQSKDSP